MTTQNRYYSNIATATTITTPGGLSTTTPNVQLASTSGFPTSFPFILRLEPNTLNEEIVLVTSGAGTSLSPYAITRGFDQTTAKTHAAGVPVQHGFGEIDFAEPQQHINLTAPTSAAHSLPASAWNNMSLQLVQSQTLAATAASVTFSSIPQTFNHLYFKVMAQCNGTSVNGDSDYVGVQWNGVVSATYNSVGTYYYGPGGGTTQVLTAQTSGNQSLVALVWNSRSGTPGAAYFTAEFPFYSTTTFRKSYISSGQSSDGGSASAIFDTSGGNTSNTNAITSVTFVASATPGNATLFVAGSVFSMYGSQ